MRRVWPDWIPGALTHWFAASYPAPTSVQDIAWRRALRGDHTLIVAPTGSGKTLAALFTALARLGADAARGALISATGAIYLAPSDDDLDAAERLLGSPLAALNATLPTPQRLQADRTGHPHLLLTTPERLHCRLGESAVGLAPRLVLVDEFHRLAETPRGAFTALLLERLEALAPAGLQRLALSATVSPAAAMAQLLCGHRPCAIVQDSIRRTHRIDLYTLWDPPPDDPTAVTLTGTPQRIVDALQQLRRHSGQMASGRLVATSPADLLAAIALREAVRAGALEPLEIPVAPLAPLAQALDQLPAADVGTLAQFRRSGPYLQLSAVEFDHALTHRHPLPPTLPKLSAPSLSPCLAEEQLRLRRALREAFASGGEAAVELHLREVCKLPPRLATSAAAFVAAQSRLAPLPVDSPVQIEQTQWEQSPVLLVHSLAGRTVHQALVDSLGTRAGANEQGFWLLGVISEADLRAALATTRFSDPAVAALAERLAATPWEWFVQPTPSPLAASILQFL